MAVQSRPTKTSKGVKDLIVPSAEQVDPEWAKVRYITQRFQIGRSIAFKRIADGTWKSVLLRDKGCNSGIRLVYVPSVREHLMRLLKQQKSAA